MKFIIDGKIAEKFPGLSIGAVIAKGLDNSGNADGLAAEMRATEAAIRAKYTQETMPLDPKIDCWKKAYAAFGGEPKKNRSSVENLYRLVLNGIELRSVNRLVDCYNLVCLRRMLPLGGEDLDRMQGDISLTFAGPNEPPVMLLGDKEPHPPRNGEVIYKDAVSAICRRWNWREAERTKLTGGTKNCILVVEGLPPVSRAEVDAATRELGGLVKKYCGGGATVAIMDAEKREIGF